MLRSLKLKKVLKISFFILGSLLMTLPLILGQTQLFFEDWEAGDFADWINTNWAIATDQKHGGSNSAKCETTDKAGLECAMNSTVSADTSSAETVNVSFWYMDDDCDGTAGGDVHWYWKDNAGNWDLIGLIDAGTLSAGDDTWNYHSAVSLEAQYKHAGFAVRFDALLEKGENYWVDDINVSYIEAPEDSCTCPGAGNNWEIDMSDYCNITEVCDLTTGTLSFTGEGITRCDAEIKTSDFQGPASGLLEILDDCLIYES